MNISFYFFLVFCNYVKKILKSNFRMKLLKVDQQVIVQMFWKKIMLYSHNYDRKLHYIK